jgi:hypothetical protein
MNERIFVIAGNYDQFKSFRRTLISTMIKEDINVRQTNIIYFEKQLVYGYDDIWGYRVGTWHKRDDLDEIRMILMSRRSSIDNFIEVELYEV